MLIGDRGDAQHVQLIFRGLDAIVVAHRLALDIIVGSVHLAQLCQLSRDRMRLQSVTERKAFFVTLLAVLVLALLPVPRLTEFELEVGLHYDRLNHATVSLC
ncbi:hypothetical protein [Mesorhizobium sp.]|uniref:hypothetical protein n=1 Tax=Mesorhizobium sp. TaxID=1871066 RepID=UPI00257E6B4E|nr:hypothetical protein [Mesorhizobium sp.]